MKESLVKSFLAGVFWMVALGVTLRHNQLSFAEISHAFEPGYGRSALPEEVVEMKQYLEKSGATSFRFSPMFAFDKNATVNQRGTEYLYPIRDVATASLVFAAAEERLSDCRLLEKMTRISVYACN